MTESTTTTEPTSIPVEVRGGTLAVFRYGPPAPPERTVLALHGITASSRCWPALARQLPDDWALVAVDLRGRGASRHLPGAGLDGHVGDLTTVLHAIDPDGTGQVTVLGHSMGAYVALLLADHAPDAIGALVLVDGGVPLPLPPDADPDEVLAATLGPALARLSQTYPDAEAYVDFFRQHPALGPHWSPDVETYVRYDVLEVAGGVRSRAVEDAVRADGRDLLVMGDRLDAALRGLSMPTSLLTAPLGMLGQPPGLVPEAAVAGYVADVEVLSADTIEGANHYTIVLDSNHTARIAEAVTG